MATSKSGRLERDSRFSSPINEPGPRRCRGPGCSRSYSDYFDRCSSLLPITMQPTPIATPAAMAALPIAMAIAPDWRIVFKAVSIASSLSTRLIAYRMYASFYRQQDDRVNRSTQLTCIESETFGQQRERSLPRHRTAPKHHAPAKAFSCRLRHPTSHMR